MLAPLLLALTIAPLAAAILCLGLRRPRLCEGVNLVAASIAFAAALPLPFLVGGRQELLLGGWVIIDRASAWIVLCSAIVYVLASIYAVGYMRLLGEDRRLYEFYALFAGFGLSILAAPLMNNIGLYWIAIELTTLVSTFLVAFERAPESMEAAWKYIMLVSAGISLALLGTVLFYWNGSFVLGPDYQMTWAALAAAAPRMNPLLSVVAFLLVLVGYGTKVGLAPMHAWLPDAHGESPAPVSAMLSGALLNTAMIGIVRFLGITRAADLGELPALALVAFGVLSLLVGALFIVRQQGVKRLMAYSSIEHMGVVALGFGFGGALGVGGAFYHMLNHSLNKSLMFFGAGNMMRAYGTKEIPEITGVARHFPVQGMLWLAGAVAITGAPPFGLFLSEFTIMRAGLKPSFSWAVYAMAVLLIVIFIGFLNQFRRMYDAPQAAGAAPSGRVSAWCAVPMWLALAPVLVLGLWWPNEMWTYLTSIAHTLSPGGAVTGIETIAASDLPERVGVAIGGGGRMQFAYALPAAPGRIELRYVGSRAQGGEFFTWRCVPQGPVPSVAAICPLLGWYEREIADLFGAEFAGHPEPHPLVLRHGPRPTPPPFDPAWPPEAKLSAAPQADWLPEIANGDVQLLPFGPVRADVVESAEFVFFYVGEHILHLHPRLFFKHRGMEKRFEGKTLTSAVVLAERVSGVGSFAHALAFCQAVEAAAGADVPPRARILRSLLAELERLYNHLHYLGHLAHTTTLKVGEAEGKLLEERAKQLNGRLTGSRFLRGLLIPGGLRRDLDPAPWLGAELDRLGRDAAAYTAMLEATSSHLDRLITTGVLTHEVAFDQGATGPIQRASGFARDLRRDHPYAGYDAVPPAVPVRTSGDAHARAQLRIAELDAGIDLIRRALPLLAAGPVRADCVPLPGSEGLGWAESPRGSLFYAVHFGADGVLSRVKIKSPSFSNWRVFPFTVHGSNMMDYAINEASFGLTIAGCDR